MSGDRVGQLKGSFGSGFCHLFLLVGRETDKAPEETQRFPGEK